MKKVLLLVWALTFALSATAFARSLGLPNELVNGSFEEGLGGWTLEGRSGEQATQEPQDGQYVFRSITSGNQPPPDGHLSQIVQVAPGYYEVDLSGWIKGYVLDGGYQPHPEWGWMAVQLTIDGEVVAEQMYQRDDTWYYVELFWEGQVLQYKDVHIIWGTEPIGDWRTFDVMLADGFDLEERIIPEPMSMLVVLGGLAGMIARRRR